MTSIVATQRWGAFHGQCDEDAMRLFIYETKQMSDCREYDVRYEMAQDRPLWHEKVEVPLRWGQLGTVQIFARSNHMKGYS